MPSFSILLEHISDAIAYSDDLAAAVGYVFRFRGPHRFKWGSFPFLLRIQDRVAFVEIVKEGEYAFISALLPDSGSPRVLDVGANIGLFSLQVFQCNPKSWVTALEPSPDTFAILGTTRKLNGTLQWEVRQEALFNSEGTVEFATTGSSTARRIQRWEAADTVKVPSITLETLAIRLKLPASIDLMKLDIEGAEEAVLRCSGGFLRRVQYLVIELHDDVDQGYCISVLREAYPYLFRVTGRTSKKPLLIGSRVVLHFATLQPI